MRRMLGVVIAAGLLAGAGCSGDHPASATPPAAIPEPSAVPEATVSDLNSATLPLDAYLLTARQWSDLDYASRLLVRDCMRRFGIDWDPGDRNDFEFLADRTNRLGLVDRDQAARFGYHVDPAKESDYENKDARRDHRLSAEETRILTGGAPDAPANGDIPAGGCTGEARRKIGWSLDTTNFLQAMGNLATGKAFADRRAGALDKAWSRCMKKSGYSYARPRDVEADRRWNYDRPPSQAEINTAVADVDCKKKINYLGEMTAILTAYQKEVIEVHRERLDAAKAETQEALRRAADVLGGR